jgi:hypothetical protein
VIEKVWLSLFSENPETGICYRFATQSSNGWLFSSFDCRVNLLCSVGQHPGMT